MRVLITGHLGFIGAVMVPMVQNAGHEVTGLDIGLYDGCDFGPPAAPIREIRADLRDVDGSLFRGFDAVIHLAALSNDPLGDLDAQLTYDINHLATVRLASLAPPAIPCSTKNHRSIRSRRTVFRKFAPKAIC
jgi:nucleoside-diphosphate-sugar epimerase